MRTGTGLLLGGKSTSSLLKVGSEEGRKDREENGRGKKKKNKRQKDKESKEDKENKIQK